jgi:hypothetical protein
MAFPGELNINYYRGDTYEFNITPKKNDGTSFDLSGYTVKFTIAPSRGSSSIIEGWAQITTATNTINCAITPGNGEAMTAGQTYIYDVEIKNPSTSNYESIYTILTGNISVTEQVSA